MVPLGGIAYLGRDSHYANIPYNLWKVHLVSYEKALPYRYIYVDDLFRNHLKGKSREELETWFPDLRKSTAEEEYRNMWEENYFPKHNPGCQVYWSDWNNAFVFKGDRLVDMMLCKG